MKRSYCNDLLKARIEFSTLYYAFSTKDDSEPYFSHSGCEICPDGLAGDVHDITYLSKDDKGREVHESEICNSCLCSLVNGDDTDLDYICDDDDEPELTAREATDELIAEKENKPTKRETEFRQNMTNLLLGMSCYQSYSIYVNGETTERTVNEMFDWFIVQTNDDETRELRAYFAENETDKVIESLSNNFDFYFTTEPFEN